MSNDLFVDVPSFLSREEVSIFFPSLSGVELCLPTLLGVFNSSDIFVFLLHFSKYIQNVTTARIDLKDQR